MCSACSFPGQNPYVLFTLLCTEWRAAQMLWLTCVGTDKASVSTVGTACWNGYGLLHHLFHIFKYDVQDFLLKIKLKPLKVTTKIRLDVLKTFHLDRRSTILDLRKWRKTSKGHKLFRLASQPCNLYQMDGRFEHAALSK